jgi:hypothetical protein
VHHGREEEKAGNTAAAGFWPDYVAAAGQQCQDQRPENLADAVRRLPEEPKLTQYCSTV